MRRQASCQLYERSTSASRTRTHRIRTLRIGEEIEHGLREIFGAIGNPQMLAVDSRNPFGADCRRNHRRAHSHGFENLQPRPAAAQQRHDEHARGVHVRPKVFDAAGELDAAIGTLRIQQAL